MATVRETLALSVLQGACVLAGGKGLDHEISAVNFLDAADSWRWVQSGDFALLSVCAFQPEIRLLEVFRELANRGAAGACVKLNESCKQLPQSVIALIEEQSLPVISVPDSVSFAEISRPLQKLIIRDHARLLKFSERIRHSFFDLSVHAAGIEDIIRTLNKFTYADCVFFEVRTGKLFFSDAATPSSAELNESCLKALLDTYPHEDVVLDGQLMGHLIIKTTLKRLKERSTALLIEQVKGALILYFQRQEAKRQAESRYRNEFVQDLITRNIRMEQEAWNRARLFGWNLTGAHRVVVVDIDNYKSTLVRAITGGKSPADIENTKKRIYTIALSFLEHLDGGNFPYAEMSDSIVFIFPSQVNDNDLFYTKLLAALKEMMAAVFSATGFTVSVGVGEPRSRVFDCCESYHEACQGIELLRTVSGGGNIASWAEMGIYKLLEEVSGTPEGERFVRRWIGPLQESNRLGDQDLLTTLITVVDCCWNLKEAARLLKVHYNTLKYRWNKICCMLGFDPSKSSDQLNVMVALKLLQLRRASNSELGLLKLGARAERTSPQRKKLLTSCG